VTRPRPTGPLGEVLAEVWPGFFQQAFVVADLDAARAALGAAIGVERWNVLPAAMLPYELRGRTVECSLGLAFARSGGVQLELIRPEAGEGLHVEFLAEHGPGAHHLGFLVDTLEETLADATGAGVPVAMSGEFGTLRFAYLDTWDALGSYVEVVEDPDGIMRDLTP